MYITIVDDGFPWEYWPYDEKRSPCGYVGILNLGATCYMAVADVTGPRPGVVVIHEARPRAGIQLQPGLARRLVGPMPGEPGERAVLSPRDLSRRCGQSGQAGSCRDPPSKRSSAEPDTWTRRERNNDSKRESSMDTARITPARGVSLENWSMNALAQLSV